MLSHHSEFTSCDFVKASNLGQKSQRQGESSHRGAAGRVCTEALGLGFIAG